MFPTLAVTAISAFLLYVWLQVRGLQNNIAKAKSTGFKYVVLPFHMLSIPWALTRRILLPLLDCLPSGWTEAWIPYVCSELPFLLR